NLDNFDDSAFQSLADASKKYGKEIWATEVGYDPLINDKNPAAFATWDNAMQYAKLYVRTLNVLRATLLEYWEYADDFPLTDPKLNPYPAFYVVKSYADNLAPGSQMVKAKSDNAEVLSIAARDTKHNHFFAQALNVNLKASKTVTFTGLPNVPLTLIRSSAK